ncbi:MAG: hypothetical protein Q8Q07_00050 [Dehalococcoidales bacterium]|nr:hypothetical protein [Dehalococcoidales bacterium]
MEVIKKLLVRFRQTGVLFLIGLILIVYISFGFVYWQQGVKQGEFEDQIVKLSAVIARPLPSSDALRAEYDEVAKALAPVDNAQAIKALVDAAEKNGIDVTPEVGKFRIPPAKLGQAKVGGGTYQTLTFSNVYVQGDYADVMAFISDLDSGKVMKTSGEGKEEEMKTLVLQKVTTREVEVTAAGEDAARRAEFRSVASAVQSMMSDNTLSGIPFPISFSGGVATNLMGDNPNTGNVREGFPDVTTTAAAKGYTGTGTPRGGYVLYEHDKISVDDTTKFSTVSYINTLTTEYYYTSEADGTVRQFDGANVFTAREYLSKDTTKSEIGANIDLVIYYKSG